MRFLGSESGVIGPSAEMSRRVRAGSAVNLPCNTTPGDEHSEPRRPAGRSRDVTSNQQTRIAHVITPTSETSISAIIVGYEWRKDDDVIATTDAIGSDVTKRPGSSRLSIDRLNGSLTVRNVSSATDVGLYVCMPRWRQRPSSDSSRRDDVSVGNFQQQQQQMKSRHLQLIVEGEAFLRNYIQVDDLFVWYLANHKRKIDPQNEVSKMK